MAERDVEFCLKTGLTVLKYFSIHWKFNIIQNAKMSKCFRKKSSFSGVFIKELVTKISPCGMYPENIIMKM